MTWKSMNLTFAVKKLLHFLAVVFKIAKDHAWGEHLQTLFRSLASWKWQRALCACIMFVFGNMGIPFLRSSSISRRRKVHSLWQYICLLTMLLSFFFFHDLFLNELASFTEKVNWTCHFSIFHNKTVHSDEANKAIRC